MPVANSLLPSISSAVVASVTTPALSVVIPAYNEALRLPDGLAPALRYLTRQFAGQFEIIIVDDGSQDNTSNVARFLIGAYGRVIRLEKNRGKGAAVRTGIEAARGSVILVMDADGATPIEELARAWSALSDGASVVIGCRYNRRHKTSLPPGEPQTRTVEMGAIRRLSGKLFAFIVKTGLGLKFSDTQCGFKLFEGNVARSLVTHCQIDGFGIDFELLYLAERAKLKTVELPIAWKAVEGSKVSLLRDSWRLLLEILRVRSLHKHRPVQLKSSSDPVLEQS